MKSVSLKLIFRNWWRNKAFAVIAVLSLAIGIACTNLLAAFVIYEYNVETENPNKDRIFLLMSKSSGEQKRSVYVRDEDYTSIVGQLPEITQTLRLSLIENAYCKVEENFYTDIILLRTDTSFTHFFPVDVVAGDLRDVLNSPYKIALNESTAKRLFGKKDPMNQLVGFNEITFRGMDIESTFPSYTVGAILKDRSQSLIAYDALIGGGENHISFVMTAVGVKSKTLNAKIKALELPVWRGRKLEYSALDVKETYFNREIKYRSFRSGESVLLQIGLFSAFFILIIACINYVNLSFSRIFQQLHTIHVQKLMAAEAKSLTGQLFADTFLTVFLAFLLSLLIQHDLLPLFNQALSVSVPSSFFYSYQVLPVTLGFTLLLAIIPALYMSRKLPTLSLYTYREFYTGTAKRRIISALAILQFVISIGLLTATFTVREQLSLLLEKNEDFPYIYSLSSEELDTPVNPVKEKIKLLPGVASVSSCEYSMTFTKVWGFNSPDGSGPEFIFMMNGDEDMATTLNLKQVAGIPWREAVEIYGTPVFITKTYADKVFPDGKFPIGDVLASHDRKIEFDYSLILAGVVEDFNFITLAEGPRTYLLTYNTKEDKHLQIRLDPSAPSGTLNQIRNAWKSIYPDRHCKIESVYDSILRNNSWTVKLSKLLLMYSIISLFLTCFGLFGMALYVTGQRTKEIGIRKVNGASTFQMVWMLNKQFVYWIVFALIITIPITWYFLNRWLETLVYRRELSLLTFLLSALIVLLVTLITVSWHSYKAASSNPVSVLKSE